MSSYSLYLLVSEGEQSAPQAGLQFRQCVCVSGVAGACTHMFCVSAYSSKLCVSRLCVSPGRM